MRKLAVLVALCVPLIAKANLLFVNYEGSVSGIEEQSCPCPHTYSVGDPVSGKLTIDLALAEGRPPSSNATMADYLPGPFSFVNGRPLAATGRVNDAVFLYDNLAARAPAPANTTYDRVEIYDGVVGQAADMFGITLERLSPYGQLITGVGSVQQFDATPDEGTTLTGLILRSLSGAVGAFTQRVNVAFTHVSMGVCKP